MRLIGLALWVSLCLVNTHGCAANVKFPDPERIRSGQEAIIRLSDLIPNDKINSIEALLKIHEGKYIRQYDWDFGAHKIMIARQFGYLRVFIEVIALDHKIGFSKISITKLSPELWSSFRKAFEDLETHDSVQFTERKYYIDYQYAFNEIAAFHYQSVSDQLGPMSQIDIASDLKNAYEYLVSPFENSEVSETGCGYATEIPEGKAAMDILIKNDRVDLIRNVLRGYNPGARILAAITLLRMQRHGLELEPETINTIRVVGELRTPINVCEGIIKEGAKGKDVMRAFLDGKDAMHSFLTN